MSQLKQRELISSPSPFHLFKTTRKWMMFTHIGWEQFSLLNLMIKILISSGVILTGTSRNNILPVFWISLSPVKLTQNFNHYISHTIPLRKIRQYFTAGFLQVCFHSVQFSCSVVSDSLRPHGLLHARPPCPSPTPEVYSNSCPLSRWCHPTISSSVFLFSSCLPSFPASGSFYMSQFFSSGGQSIGVSALTSVLPMNI